MEEIKRLKTIDGNLLAGDRWFIMEAECPYCKKDVLLVRTNDIKYCPYCGEKVSDYAVMGKNYGIFKWDNQNTKEEG